MWGTHLSYHDGVWHVYPGGISACLLLAPGSVPAKCGITFVSVKKEGKVDFREFRAIS